MRQSVFGPRKGKAWQQILDVGGSLISGDADNLFVGWQFPHFWHYSGRTVKEIWPEIFKRVPRINMINAVTYIDGVLFVCAEYDQSARDVVVLRARQVN